MSAFSGLRESIESDPDAWKVIYDENDAHLQPLPSPLQDKLSTFQKLLVLRGLRPDKIAIAVQRFVIEKSGEKFVIPPSFDLQACYDDSSVSSPLIFVLSAGSDPMSAVLRFAKLTNTLQAKQHECLQRSSGVH